MVSAASTTDASAQKTFDLPAGFFGFALREVSILAVLALSHPL